MLPQVEGPLGTAGGPRWPVGVVGVRRTTVLRGRQARPFPSMSVRVALGGRGRPDLDRELVSPRVP